MQESKAALRYARSLFSLALERNELDKVSADMELIDSTIKANRDLAVMLQSPVIKADRKAAIIKMVFGPHLGATSAAFLDLIIRKRREMYIAQIARQFVLLHLANNGVEEALLITAVPADADLKAKVIALVEKQTGNKVVLEEKVDPSVIGGFVLRYGDKQLDTSLGRELQDLKREFARNLYVKDY
jgi:F-type H+-transporting ATPase subunit delta